MRDSVLDTRRLIITAVLIAVVAVFTLVIRWPIPATGGYFNVSDVAIFFTAILFGPGPALIAGGVGAGLADILSGYPEFSWLSLIAHGGEGLLAGLLMARGGWLRMGLGWLLGSIVMVAGYYIGETGVMSIPVAQAALEVPWNIGQVVVGGIVGAALVIAVKRAYPPITQIGQHRVWRQI